MQSHVPVALTIAGSDSGGGAGIQADLRTFTALGAFGTSAITCLTAQNLDGVSGVHACTPEFVRSQIDAVFSGFHVRAIKTGMLYSRAIVEAVADALSGAGVRRLVVDPVMVATSGARLLEDDAVRAYRERLFPLAMLLTPNSDELQVLSGRACDTVAAALDGGRALCASTGVSVLVKGGHLPGPAHDHLVTPTAVHEFAGLRVSGVHTHGSGCTYSAAIAAELAHGLDLPEAVEGAKQFLAEAFARPAPLSDDLRVLHAGWSGETRSRAVVSGKGGRS